MKNLPLVLAPCSVLLMLASSTAADWITAPSTYTHDPRSGERVTQYAPIGPVYTHSQSNFTRSGYRQLRSSIQAGGSADHMHIVEEWGRPVRPYGEWQFPYRPYSAPYPYWGAPFAGLSLTPWPGTLVPGQHGQPGAAMLPGQPGPQPPPPPHAR